MSSNIVEEFFDFVAPKWDEMESHSIDEKKYLLNKVNINEGDKVLDVACGTGVITGLIHSYSNTNVVGIDISNNMINIAKEKYKNDSWASFYHNDFLDFDETNKYDVAIIYNAFPHFLNSELVVNKLTKILNKNGKFAILHSLSRSELEKHHEHCTNVSRVLQNPIVEAKLFEKDFDILEASETEHTFVLIGRLK